MVRILDTSGYMWIPRGTTCSNKPKVWHFHHTPLELGLSLATKWAPQLGLLSLGNCFHLFGDSHLLNLSSREHVYVLHHLTWIDIVSLRFSQVSDSIWYRSGFSLFLTSIRMLGTSWKQLLKSNDIKAIMGYYGQHGAILHLVWSFGRPGILETKSRRGDCGRMDFAAEDKEKRREREEKESEERVRRKKLQERQKVEKPRMTVCSQWFVTQEGRKVGSLKRRVRSHLVSWEMKNCLPLWSKC